MPPTLGVYLLTNNTNNARVRAQRTTKSPLLGGLFGEVWASQYWQAVGKNASAVVANLYGWTTRTGLRFKTLHKAEKG